MLAKARARSQQGRRLAWRSQRASAMRLFRLRGCCRTAVSRQHRRARVRQRRGLGSSSVMCVTACGLYACCGGTCACVCACAPRGHNQAS